MYADDTSFLLKPSGTAEDVLSNTANDLKQIIWNYRLSPNYNSLLWSWPVEDRQSF